MNVLHAHIPPHTHDDQGKRVAAIYWDQGRRQMIRHLMTVRLAAASHLFSSLTDGG
jgi:hypothetical protein